MGSWGASWGPLVQWLHTDPLCHHVCTHIHILPLCAKTCYKGAFSIGAPPTRVCLSGKPMMGVGTQHLKRLTT